LYPTSSIISRASSPWPPARIPAGIPSPGGLRTTSAPTCAAAFWPRVRPRRLRRLRHRASGRLFLQGPWGLPLWATRWYEARTIAVFVDDPDEATSEQMDGWTEAFDNWAICD